MSWGIDVIDRIQRQLGVTGDDSTTVTVDDWQVQVDAETAGSVGVAANRVRVRAPRPTDLAETGRALAGRVDYLLEPLRLLEVAENRALLRSAPPTLNDDANDYYEIWLRDHEADTEVDVRRYRYDKEQRERTLTPLKLTWETAGRLLDDVRKSVEGT